MMPRARLAAIALGALAGGIGFAGEAPRAAEPPAPALSLQSTQRLELPPPEVLLAMIRWALIALEHANRTGNYAVLRELGGPGLQQHSTGEMSNAFAALRDSNVSLLQAAVVTPELIEAPRVSPEGFLQLVGYVPSLPRRIEFHIVYEATGGEWKLSGLRVGLGQAPAPGREATPKAAPQADSGGRPAAAASGN